MMYRTLRNSIAHKEKWDLVKDKRQRKFQYDQAVKLMHEAASADGYIVMKRKDILRSALEKCAKYLYN